MHFLVNNIIRNNKRTIPKKNRFKEFINKRSMVDLFSGLNKPKKKRFKETGVISQNKVFTNSADIVDDQLPPEIKFPPGVKLHPKATSSGKAKLFSISLINGSVSVYFVQGVAFLHENRDSLVTGDPVLMESNQHCSTHREVNSVGSLVHFEDRNGLHSTGRIGPGETYIEADFMQHHLSPGFWKEPISIRCGRSCGFLCQVRGDPTWFGVDPSKFNFPPVDQKDGRIQISRKGATMYGPDFEKFVKEQKAATEADRIFYNKGGLLPKPEYELWNKLTRKEFNAPKPFERAAALSQLHYMKLSKLCLEEDDNVDKVTGLLSMPLSSEKLDVQDGFARIAFISKPNLTSSFVKFQESHDGRDYFLSKDEHDEFVSGIPDAKMLDLSVVDIMKSGLKRQYIDLNGEQLGCLVGDEEQVKLLSDVSSVERLLSVKQDLIKSKASNPRSPDSKPHVGHQIYSNMHQTGQATPSPTRGPTETAMHRCKNSGDEFDDVMRHGCARKGDPIAANRLCHNGSILSLTAAQLGRLLMISHGIGEKDHDNWRFDLDILTIDWFNGMHTDVTDKHNGVFSKDYQDRIQHVKEAIEGLTPEEVDFIESKPNLAWTLDFWKMVTQANDDQKSNRPITTTCTWCDVNIKTKEVLAHDSSEFEVHRHFPFPTTGKCLRLFSKVCLSWFASKLEHGTTATVGSPKGKIVCQSRKSDWLPCVDGVS